MSRRGSSTSILAMGAHTSMTTLMIAVAGMEVAMDIMMRMMAMIRTVGQSSLGH
jgi:hypothetical protein